MDGRLIEIKTTLDPADMRKRWWPWQLLGYVLLDYRDEHGIREVGVYLARQATLVRWPLEGFMATLAGRPNVSLPAARKAFRTVVRSLWPEPSSGSPRRVSVRWVVTPRGDGVRRAESDG